VTIQVTPVNDGPDAVDDGSAADPLTLDEDGSLFVNVLGNDTDPEGDQLTITDFDQNVYDGNNNLIGTVTMETNDLGQTGLVFTPVGDYNGPAQFEYTVSDGELEDTATVTIQVTPVNDGPDAVDDGSAADPLTLDEDGSLFVNVLGNDTDPEGDPLTITDYDHNVYDGNNNLIGTVTMETNDQGQTGLVFTPEDGYTGPAQFEYTVSDGKLTDSATVTLDVISTNHDPVTSPDLFHDLPGTANDINVVTEGGTNFESNPVNYLLIVDTSGSMSTHDRIGEAKAALYQMLDSLQEQVNISGGTVKVGLIDFDGNTEGKTITLTGDPATTGYQEGINFISGFDANGSTNYEAAFQAANNWVTNESNGIDTEVIFMSDGAPNNTHNWQDDLATLHSNTHVTGVGIEMGSDSMKYINQVNEDGNGINLDDPKDLNGLLQDILTVTSTEGTTATGNVLDNDTDPDGDDLTVVGIALGDEANHGLFTDLSDVGSGADDADTAVVTGTYGTLTISANGVYTYVPDQPAADALSTGESRTESFTYQVSDGHGGTAEETVSFMINGADDAPVAVNDVYAGMQLTPGYHNTPVIDETNFNGTISDGVYHGDGFTISAESIHDGFIFNYWDDANVAKVGSSGLGVNNPGEPDGDETNNIDGYYDEDMIITFERPQATVTITLGDIQGKDTPEFHVEGGSGSYSHGVFTATGNITSITIGANDNDKDSFYLESLNATAVASSADWVSATMTPSTLTGNVLLNDFDAEDVDHVQTHGTGTELTVLGASGADGYVSLADATTDGSATSGVIHGQYGDLTLHTDGHFEYHVDSSLINSVNGPGVETFEYQITDSDGMTSMATLEFPITVAGDSSVVVGTTGNDILLGDDGDNILFGLSGDDNVFISSGHDTVTLGEGADTITIDPSYLNGGDGTMTVTDFHQGEDLFAIDHLIGDGKVSVEVSTSGVNNSDLNLVFTDLDGQHDMTVILQGVNPDMNHIPDTPEPISTGDDLNTLIQSIINSGGNHSS
jgi:VCBS repeat-containing protein